MKKLLSDLLLKGTSAPEEGRTEISDERCSGLEFRITSKDIRSFSFRFRDPITGRPARIAIGRYPDVSLSQARQAANSLRAEVALGTNPVERKRLARADAPKRTFAALSERYLNEHARRHKKSAAADERNLKLHVLPRWQNRPYDSIKRADVIELVESLVMNGSPVQANRIQALVSSIFSFALDADLVQMHPCLRLKKRGTETARTRVLSDSEIRLFWHSSVLPPVSRAVGLALRLALLTGARAGEASGASIAEIENLDQPLNATWTIPADRSKNGIAHLVPLSSLAVETIRNGLAIRDANSRFLFPSPTNRDAPIAAHALAVAMQRMTKSYLAQTHEQVSWRHNPPCPHDLRRTAATKLASLGVAQEDISAVLNHVRRDITGRVYDLYNRRKEKYRALTLLSDHIAELLERPTKTQ